LQLVKKQIIITGTSLLVGLLLVVGLAQASDTAVSRESEAAPASPDSLLVIIADAWIQGDERALADIVHPDGVRINSGNRGDRLTRYSPSQAFYFFKNLFQKRKTTEFSFVRVQDRDDQDLTHAKALWLWHQDGASQDKEEEFIFVIRLKEDRWFLSEINSIK